MPALAVEIRRLRKACGLTQEQLADKLGLTQGFITQLETGRSKGVTVENLYALSDALGVTCEHWRKFMTTDEPPAKGKPARKKK